VKTNCEKGLLLALSAILLFSMASQTFGSSQYDKTTNAETVGLIPRLTSSAPPLIGQFAAPDGATRGLAFDGTYLWSPTWATATASTAQRSTN
jgi:hypothetical protein